VNVRVTGTEVEPHKGCIIHFDATNAAASWLTAARAVAAGQAGERLPGAAAAGRAGEHLAGAAWAQAGHIFVSSSVSLSLLWFLSLSLSSSLSSCSLLYLEKKFPKKKRNKVSFEYSAR
jgi:hypothetical protein